MNTTSWIDAVIIFMLVTSIAFGFHQGFLRQVFLLVALYIGTVLSAHYHGHLAGFISDLFPSSSEEMARIVGFGILLLVFTIATGWLIWNAYRETRLPSAVMLDHAGGAALGAAIGIFAIALTLVLAQYALDAPWPEGSDVRHALHTGVRDSALQVAFRSPLPIMRFALDPLLPAEIPLFGS